MKADNGADRCGKRFSVNEGTPRSVMLIGLSVNKNALQEGTEGFAESFVLLCLGYLNHVIIVNRSPLVTGRTS